MEPITHLMTGAVLARAGFNRKAAYATIVMVLAAEAPDLDVLWSFVGPHAGPVAAFQHHRGWTHTFLGAPLEAALLIAVFWLMHRWRARRLPSPKSLKAPIRWSLLYLFALIALLSHILLDWTNNYGVRPFFPFNPRWYAGSFVYIFDPVLFLILLSSLVGPSLFGLINSEVGARRPAFRGQNWAIAGLLLVLTLWSWRLIEHSKALQLAATADYAGAPVLRASASPSPANPYHWNTVVETPDFDQLATVNTRTGALITDPHSSILYKPPTTLATLVAKRTWLGQVYLDWSKWPRVTESTSDRDGLTTVIFRDLRFPGETPLFDKRDGPPLSGKVTLDADRRVLRMEMDGRTQH